MGEDGRGLADLYEKYGIPTNDLNGLENSEVGDTDGFFYPTGEFKYFQDKAEDGSVSYFKNETLKNKNGETATGYTGSPIKVTKEEYEENH